MSRLETKGANQSKLNEDVPYFAFGYKFAGPVYTIASDIRARGVTADQESPFAVE